MPNASPLYTAKDGIHTMDWGDKSRLIMEHPHLEKGAYVAFTKAYCPSGDLAGEAPLRIFDTKDVVPFALRCSAANGAKSVDWNARLACIVASQEQTPENLR